ncbi:FUSC family protein [uncultured Pseudoxanthomonas sp.]|uniref:FUSC family protein n=1 Tax=uncultured Pseudoxanthomonas sp. TaxID=281701 RepID=UPI00259483D7|nr:FUSC family protein [uncultured Pseudoxanthomonas sp.]
MSAAPAAASPTQVPLSTQVREALRGEGPAWLFVFKVLLSMYLAAWIAMRMGFASPSTSMVTVIVLMNRQSGMVLAKSFYRALGTIVGSIAAVTITALFPQQPVLFLLALSLWVGMCAGGALAFRNFRSYGFVLSGYTVAIIALPAVNTPMHVFDLAIARLTEVLLGIAVSAVVFDVVFPVRLRNSLRTTATTLMDSFLDFVRDGTRGTIPRAQIEQAHLRFVRQSMALEDLRASVVFEDPEARVRSRRMRLLNQRFMAASTRFQSLHHLMNRLQQRDRDDPVFAALLQLYRPLGDALAERAAGADYAQLSERLEAVFEAQPARATALRASLAAPLLDDFDTGASLLRRLTGELRDLTHTAAALQQPGVSAPLRRANEQIRFHYATDRVAVAVTVARSFLVTFVLGLAWMQSGWTSGAGAMANVIAFTAILASGANAHIAAAQTTKGIFLGLLSAFLCFTLVLPRIDSFGMLVLGSAPFFMVAVYLSTRPTLFGLSLGMCLGSVVGLGLGLAPNLDTSSFINGAVALGIGALLAMLAFQLIPSVIGTPGQRRRLLIELRRQVTLAARAPLSGLAPRFESVSRDLFLQVVNHTQQGSDESRTLLAWALSVHETGRTLIELRHDSIDAAVPPSIEAHIDAAVAAIGRLYDHLSPADHDAALAHLDAALNQTLIEGAVPPSLQPVREHLHLLRSALRDADSVLAGAAGRAPAPEPARATS